MLLGWWASEGGALHCHWLGCSTSSPVPRVPLDEQIPWWAVYEYVKKLHGASDQCRRRVTAQTPRIPELGHIICGKKYYYLKSNCWQKLIMLSILLWDSKWSAFMSLACQTR